MRKRFPYDGEHEDVPENVYEWIDLEIDRVQRNIRYKSAELKQLKQDLNLDEDQYSFLLSIKSVMESNRK